MADCETVRNVPLLIQYNNLPLLPFSHPHWAVREDVLCPSGFVVLLIGLMVSAKKSISLLRHRDIIRKHFL